MQKMFEINQTKIKGGCHSGRKVVTHNSKSDLSLHSYLCLMQVLRIFFRKKSPYAFNRLAIKVNGRFLEGVTN